MSVQYTLLGFLAEESNYGYELKKKYDGYFGKDKPILTGQIYSTLARLKRDNKVKEIAYTSESGGPDRVGITRGAVAAAASDDVYQGGIGDFERRRCVTVSG